MRIAVVCQGMPHPSRGASLVIYHSYIRGLVEAGHSVRLFILDGGPAGPEPGALAELTETLGHLGEFSASRVAGFPPTRHKLTGIDIDVALAKTLVDGIAATQPDVILCFDWIAAALTLDARAPRVVWLGDLQFETLPWHTRFALEEGSRRYDRLLLLPLRINQLKQFYVRNLRGAKVIVSSKSSEDCFAALGISTRYLPYAWPALDVHAPTRPKSEHPTFLFSGTLQALGSRSAFHSLFRQIYPRTRDLFGAKGFEILVTGLGKLPDWVAAELARRPEIHFMGYVDDLAAVMSACDAFIAPIDVPVGNRTRIITCMAAGLPVVAHPFTALGNPLLKDRETCLLAADPEEFAAKMAEVARDATLACAIARKAHVAYAHSHAPEAANSALIEYLSPSDW